ncbi:MAG: phage major capsid protein [Acidimicrobiales bacterium]
MSFEYAEHNSSDLPSLIDKRSTLRDEIARLANAETVTPAEDARLDAALAEFERLDKQIAVVRSAQHPANVKPTNPTAPQVMHRVEAWGVDADRHTITDRAAAALDQMERTTHLEPNQLEAVERSMKMADQRDPMAEWVVTHGDPAYTSAWMRWLSDPATGPTEFDDRERDAWRRARATARAMTGDVSAGGGVQVPVLIDPAIMLQNAGAIDPMLNLARVETIATDTLKLVTSQGVTAEWLAAQATEVADATPSDLSQPTVATHAWDAFISASFEYVADVRSATAEIAKVLADAAQRLHANAWVNGTGASGQPTGWITTMSNGTQIVSGTSGAAGAATLVLDDAYALLEATPARYRPNAAWQASLPVINSIRKLSAQQTSAEGIWNQLSIDSPPLLLGRPIVENSSMDATIVSGSTDLCLAVGDWRAGYCIALRVGSSLEVVPHMLGSNRRPNLTRGYLLWGRAGGATIQSNSMRILKL